MEEGRNGSESVGASKKTAKVWSAEETSRWSVEETAKMWNVWNV